MAADDDPITLMQRAIKSSLRAEVRYADDLYWTPNHWEAERAARAAIADLEAAGYKITKFVKRGSVLFDITEN